MPGLAAYDFGDMVRTSTTSAKEDEPDLARVLFLPPMYDALARGYVMGARDFLTEAEARSLAFGGFLMTYEVGIRFLTDFLKGNIYFNLNPYKPSSNPLPHKMECI